MKFLLVAPGLIALNVILAVTATTAAFATEAENKSEQAYMLCVRRAAVRLEPSGEPAPDIAEAALGACLAEGADAINLLINDPDAGISPSGLQETARMFAIGQVVGVRLCKKTKDCAYAEPN